MDSNAVFAVLLLIVGLAILSAEVFIPSGGLLGVITFLSLLDLIGEAATFFSYAVVAVLGFVFVWFLVPETKGRTLEEIQEGFVARAKRKG